MKEISTIDLEDFYFNGHFLSEFEGQIAGINSGYPSIYIKSSETRQTEKIAGKHGEIIYGNTLNPFTFDVPVLFNNLEFLSDIRSWLYVNAESKFYFVDDSVFCMCMLDTNAIDLDNIGKLNGNMCALAILKFIAYTPFWFNLYENKIIQSSSLSSFSLYNDGNFESLPNIKLICSGTQNITLGINGNVFTINNVVGNVYINSQYMTVSTGSTNMIHNFVGDFGKFVLKAGSNQLSVTNATSVEIETKSRWI